MEAVSRDQPGEGGPILQRPRASAFPEGVRGDRDELPVPPGKR